MAEAKASMTAKPSVEAKTAAAVMAARETARIAAAEEAASADSHDESEAAQSPQRPEASTSMPVQTLARGMAPKAARMQSTNITPDGSEDEGEGTRLGALAPRVVPTPATGLGRKAMPPPAKPTGSNVPARKAVAAQDDALSVTSAGTSVFGEVGKSWQAGTGGQRAPATSSRDAAIQVDEVERVARGPTQSSARAALTAALAAPRPAVPSSARASAPPAPRTGTVTPRPPFLGGKPSVGKSMFDTVFEAPRVGLKPVARPASAAPRAKPFAVARPASSARPKDMFSDEL